MMLVQTYLDRDDHGGICVFAGELIRAESLIWMPKAGIDITRSLKWVNKLEPEVRSFWDTYSYPVFYANERFRGVQFNGDNGRFMNHDENPNTYEISPTQILAWRDIRKGQPITCHYGDFWAPELETWERFRAHCPYVNTKVQRTWRTSAMEALAKAA